MHYSQVVRVFTTQMKSCFDIPWQTNRPQKGSGSGVYLGNNEILTGAHVINQATFIQVQKLSSPNKAIAKIKSICHDCDLALLHVEDESFLEDLVPAEVGELPELNDQVKVIGFPMGGEQVSITNGVVSRVDMNTYSHSWRYLLCITIDAAINPGNSGGPVFGLNGEIVGVAFQKNMNAENCGQMVPPPVIHTFLKEARSGKEFVSFPSLGILMQALENKELRHYFKVPQDESGMLINTVSFDSSCYTILKPGDILHQIGPYPISNMGTIMYSGKHRTKSAAALSDLCVGDSITLKFSRQGEMHTQDVILKPMSVLAPSEEGIANRYLIYGGLVFQPLTRKYLQTWKRLHQAPPPLRYFYSAQEKTEECQEIIVLAHILSDEVNVGYEDFHYEIITEMNGIALRDLEHLHQLLEGTQGQIRLRTAEANWIILNGDLVAQRNQIILDRYQIPKAAHLDTAPLY
jgi:S1-C subfamily serine protease